MTDYYYIKVWDSNILDYIGYITQHDDGELCIHKNPIHMMMWGSVDDVYEAKISSNFPENYILVIERL